jgi:TolB-like protein
LSLFTELKRRNVFRVGAAYVVAAWLVIQVAETIFPLFGFGDTPARIVVIVLAIGFVPAMIFAWAFELTPAGLKKESEVDRTQSITPYTGKKLDRMIMLVLALALSYFAFDKFVLDPAEDVQIAESAHQEGRTAALTESLGDRSIAVIPFVNISDDPGNEFFCDGLTEEILTLLAKIPELKVIGRTSSYAYKGINEDLRKIGRKLGVKTLLEGSVRKSGQRLRITAQLIDASDGSHIWSESYDRTLLDIFEIQDEVASAIIDAMKLHVSVAPTRGRPTVSAEAYTLFLNAKSLLNLHRGMEASPLLAQATTLDPNFAEAHELQAFSYFTRGGSDIPAAEAYVRSREAAAAALVIDPDLPFARALYILPDGGSAARLEALDLLERAWRDNPFNSAPLRVLIYELQVAGYRQEALRYAQQWVDREPITPMAQYSLGETLFAMGRTEEAWPPLTFAYDQGEGFALWYVPAMNQTLGNDELAIEQLEALWQAQGNTGVAWVRDLVEGARDPNRGQPYLDRRVEEITATLPAEQYTYWLNQLEWQYLQLGFLDRFYEIIFAYGPSSQGQTMADVNFFGGMVLGQTGFTSHPRFLEVAELLGIPGIWEQRGAPDFCEKIDDQWACE